VPKTGQLQEAKNKLSQVVNEALEDGPQTITRHGAAALLSVNDCREIAPKPRNLYELFHDSPWPALTSTQPATRTTLAAHPSTSASARADELPPRHLCSLQHRRQAAQPGGAGVAVGKRPPAGLFEAAGVRLHNPWT